MENHIIDLDQWLELPAGRYVLDWEQAVFDSLTADIFGFHAVQIGLPQINTLSASRMPVRWLSSNVRPASVAEIGLPLVLHDFSELPYESQSIDLIVLPHVLEFAPEPHQILREVERVLIPEGRLIISGFNRASLWGLRQFSGRWFNSHYLPQRGEFISLPRLKDWLKLLSMEIGQTHFGCYAPPCRSGAWLERFGMMESGGRRWWPYLGAVYMVQAVKRVRGMHLIGPAWKQKKLRRGAAVPVVNKSKRTNESG